MSSCPTGQIMRNGSCISVGATRKNTSKGYQRGGNYNNRMNRGRNRNVPKPTGGGLTNRPPDSNPPRFYTEGFTECFIAGTKVIMKNDPDKNIEDIKVGDEVLSYNVHTKQFEPKKVTKLYTQTHNLEDGDVTVKIRFNNGTITHNTIANPFWSKDKGFVAVDADRCNELHEWVKISNYGKDTEKLDVNDILFTYNSETGDLDEVKVEKIELIMEPDIRTYDIEVEDNHTFFANGILTHNSGMDCYCNCNNCAGPPGGGQCGTEYFYFHCANMPGSWEPNCNDCLKWDGVWTSCHEICDRYCRNWLPCDCTSGTGICPAGPG